MQNKLAEYIDKCGDSFESLTQYSGYWIAEGFDFHRNEIKVGKGRTAEEAVKDLLQELISR